MFRGLLTGPCSAEQTLRRDEDVSSPTHIMGESKRIIPEPRPAELGAVLYCALLRISHASPYNNLPRGHRHQGVAPLPSDENMTRAQKLFHTQLTLASYGAASATTTVADEAAVLSPVLHRITSDTLARRSTTATYQDALVPRR